MTSLHRLGAIAALVIVVSMQPHFASAADAKDKATMAGMTGMTRKARVELASSAAFARDGQLLAVAKQGDHLLLYRSGDQGANWSPPTIVNARPEAIAGELDIAHQRHQAEAAGDVHVAARRDGALARLGDREHLEHDDAADHADHHRDHDLDQAHAALGAVGREICLAHGGRRCPS